MTIGPMQLLVQAGKIRHWDGGNLDDADRGELVCAGGSNCITDQILDNLGRRELKRDLLPWLEGHGRSAIPKAGSIAHVRENREAADVELSFAVVAQLDEPFPVPRGRWPLDML